MVLQVSAGAQPEVCQRRGGFVELGHFDKHTKNGSRKEKLLRSNSTVIVVVVAVGVEVAVAVGVIVAAVGVVTAAVGVAVAGVVTVVVWISS